jgi:hypothetical protein
MKILTKFFYFPGSFVDSETYLKAGKDLISFGFIYSENVMPLYPLIVYFSNLTIGIINLNILFSCLNIFLIYQIAELIFKEKFISSLAAFWMAFHPFNIFYSLTGLTETFFVFLILLSFYYIHKGSYINSSFTFVLSVLVKPLFEIIAPILIFLYSYCFGKKKFLSSIKFFFYYIIIYFFLMSPWWISQFKKYGYFVRTNFSSSLVLYAGNNELNNSGGGVIHDKIQDLDIIETREDYNFDKFQGMIGFRIKDSNTWPYLDGGTQAYLTRHQVLTKAALEYIFNNPIRFIELSWVKFKRFWRIIPYTKEHQSFLKNLISISSLLPIYIFGLLGIYKIIINRIYIMFPIIFFCFFTNLIHVITISSFRYRFPIEALLILIASYGFFQFLKLFRKI